MLAEEEAPRHVPAFHRTMHQAKSALLMASILSGNISSRAKAIVRWLEKEEARVAAGHSSTEAGRNRFKDSLRDIYLKIRHLRDESKRKCGVGQRDKELGGQGYELLRKLEKEAEAALPAVPSDVVGFRAFGGGPIYRRPEGL